MVKIASISERNTQAKTADSEEEGFEAEFQPLTAEQADVWRQKNKFVSPWRVVALQAFVGALVAVLIGLISGQFRLAASAAWGVVAVVLPAIVFVRALGRQMRQIQSGSAMLSLFVWEFVKVILTVALLLAAPRVVADLSWFALVASFVVTIKVYWLAMLLGWMKPKSSSNFN